MSSGFTPTTVLYVAMTRCKKGVPLPGAGRCDLGVAVPDRGTDSYTHAQYWGPRRYAEQLGCDLSTIHVFGVY